ncbi:MAG: DNA topoisomerase 4 subunit A, partial [Rickettsiales bacterium]|nr:DNA topoisomerase 4 subunit A [Rickettsiales bacterium]
MQTCYLDYAMSVIISRALPDVRDGLKPVHRRILFSMFENGFDHTKPFKKSARIVGDVMGKYHPHGDQAIYDSMVRMAQDFSLRVPLVEGQGNFGSMDGDGAAAMRYTESRLAKVSASLLEDLDKDTVDFRPNYDESFKEPVCLPARFPNLLVNGGGGIAVGMATNIPTHNLGEVLDACIALVDNPNLSVEDLMQYVLAPDFPTGGIILGRSGIFKAFTTGRGSVVIRGRTHFEENKNKVSIIITEVPYQVNKKVMIEKIAELVKEKVIEGISDIRDETNRHGVRVVVELKHDAVPDVILNQLFKYTPLQTSFGVNMLAINKGRPEIMNLKSVLQYFIEFREEVIRRRVNYELNKARAKAHTQVGLAIAVANLDPVIKLIRESKNPDEAKAELMARDWEAGFVAPLIDLIDDPESKIIDGKYKLSAEQAKAILELRLQKLTGLEREKLSEEITELGKFIRECLDIL